MDSESSQVTSQWLYLKSKVLKQVPGVADASSATAEAADGDGRASCWPPAVSHSLCGSGGKKRKKRPWLLQVEVFVIAPGVGGGVH